MKIEEMVVKNLAKNRIGNFESFASINRRSAKKYHLPCPKNSALLEAYHKLVKTGKLEKSPVLEKLLRTKPVRSLSGIVNVSVLTKPYPCPGNCIFCPQEKGIPKSYLSGEPAVERAKRLNFDPYLQIQERLKSLESQGHPISKIDIRIIGANWSSYPKNYQVWFIKRCFEAANSYGGKKRETQNLEAAQKTNETAKSRVIGLSIETRPDWIDRKEIKQLRILGVTKVELGVQSLEEKVLKLVQRGHGLEEIAKATRLLKDAAFKVSYQIMLNLPGTTAQKEIKNIKTLFQDERFCPDYLKIYPCAIIKNTLLYLWHRQKKYRPYSLKTLIRIVKTLKSQVPPYVRIERIIRDIPANLIVKGPTKTSNLRQLVKAAMEREGLKCRCIRCREIKGDFSLNEKLKLFREEYPASGGKEIFLTFEDLKRQQLYALLRLRLPKTKTEGEAVASRPLPFFSTLSGAVLIRDVHVYGGAIDFKTKEAGSPQHRGLGKALIKEAEKIAWQEFGFKKIAVIASVGTRNYYRKLGYRLQNTYMVKNLSF